MAQPFLLRSVRIGFFQAADFCGFLQNIRFSGNKVRSKGKNRPEWGVFPPFLVCFAIFEDIFLMLKAMAKKAKSIVTLSLPKCRKRRYAMLNFICPKTASGSIHRRPLCLSPSSEVSSSLALRLYSLSRWFTSIVRWSTLAL